MSTDLARSTEPAGGTGLTRRPGSAPAAEILARASAIAAEPMRRIAPERLEAELAEFRRRTPGSAALFQRAQGVLARGSEHVDPLSSPYPLFLDHGTGGVVVDVDGNRYVDCILAGGALSLGHNHPGLNAAVVDLLRDRTGFHGHLDEFEVLAAERIIEVFPAAEAVRFVGSGAEADLAAARIARAYTGRRKIIKFRGHYHGWGDQFMVDLEVPGSGDFMAGGVPPEHYAHTVLVHPHRLDELAAALAAGDVAAVISEPFGGESGLVPFADDFHQQAIALAHQHGALYVFDEVVTGTRAGIGGAHAVLGIRPDLITLGKGLMNGYPSCGAVAGRREIIEAAGTGLPDGRPFTYIGGTMSGNVLSAAACYHTLGELTRPGVLDGAIAVTADLVVRLNALFSAGGVPFFAYHFGTILRIELTAPHALLVEAERLPEIIARRALLADYMIPVVNAGVLSRMGRDMLSCGHTRADSDRVVNAYGRLVELLG
ncbi:aminotransferase class III-fold pyridoxal phosphate-dependent enzyme [Plantactinospora sp. S1510]|uniref:Aminotransferase class III-fold pyridoxal phosphate-dependent enzyme n=1 Tax=Plantactinospora alkalitolerans TaxID=2789879 RepID=A0ABS0GW75_9ACTN|nr:aminotransferase class III-fold pyridoxal phosphate-dependent enzyme [Plantactinospora alkalitolerans]MBF9130152.1 aminotransferase class III-fold pyridoxal phosphate-dependent enzyme [Plantactinospora alkalitolerans]